MDFGPESTAAQDSQTLQKETVGFFLQRPSGRRSSRRIIQHWDRLRTTKFQAWELSEILMGLAHELASGKADKDLKRHFRNTKTFKPWFDQAYKIGSYNADFIHRSLFAFAKMNIRPPADFLRFCQQDAIDRIDDFTDIKLFNLPWIFSLLGLVPDIKLSRSWLKAAAPLLETARNTQITSALWAFSVFYAMTKDPQYKDVLSMVLPFSAERNLSRNQKCEASYAAILCAHPEFEYSYPPNGNNVSSFEKLFARYFQEAGFALKSEEDHVIDRLKKKVDFRFDEKGRDVIVELDGPNHFVRTALKPELSYNGSTYLQSALLEELYPESLIIRLRFDAIKQFSDAAQNQADIASSLKKAFNSVGTGVYETRFNGKAIALVPHLVQPA